MKTTFSLLTILGLALIPASLTSAAEEHAKHMLEGYFAVSQALFEDDLEAAKKAADGMVHHDPDSKMAEPAKKIADSEDLDQARQAFVELTKAAKKVAASPRVDMETHVMHCPMAKKGKGADWLQQSKDEVRNPYMGKKMPHCGGLKKEKG